jgi:hypothetical protein
VTTLRPIRRLHGFASVCHHRAADGLDGLAGTASPLGYIDREGLDQPLLLLSEWDCQGPGLPW